MFDGEGLCLGQGFAGNHGHAHLWASAGPVKHKVFDRIGRAPDQRLRDLGAAVCRAGPGGVQRHIEDFRRGNDQFGAETLWFQP